MANMKEMKEGVEEMVESTVESAYSDYATLVLSKPEITEEYKRQFFDYMVKEVLLPDYSVRLEEGEAIDGVELKEYILSCGTIKKRTGFIPFDRLVTVLAFFNSAFSKTEDDDMEIIYRACNIYASMEEESTDEPSAVVMFLYKLSQVGEA